MPRQAPDRLPGPDRGIAVAYEVGEEGFRRLLGRRGAFATLFDLWRDWRPSSAALPPPSAVDPQALRRILPQLMLLDVLAADRWRVRTAGERLREMFDRDLTGRELPDALPEELRSRAAATYGPSTAEGLCWLALALYVRPGSRRRLHYARMVLPLGHGGGEGARPVVTRLLVAFHWRVVPPLSLPLWELLESAELPARRRDVVCRPSAPSPAG